MGGNALRIHAVLHSRIHPRLSVPLAVAPCWYAANSEGRELVRVSVMACEYNEHMSSPSLSLFNTITHMTVQHVGWVRMDTNLGVSLRVRTKLSPGFL